MRDYGTDLVDDSIEELNVLQKFVRRIAGLIGIYTATILISAIAYSYAESKTFLDSLWWAMVTSTTVGYGDMYPETTAGRIVAGFQMHVVPFLIMPLIIARLSAKLIVDEDAFTHDEQEQIKNDLQEIKDMLNASGK